MENFFYRENTTEEWFQLEMTFEYQRIGVRPLYIV